MSKLIKRGKIALVVSLTISTVVWSIGLAAFTPTVFAASAGDLIKQEGSASVYYLGANNKRYTFANRSTFESWYGSSATVATVSSETLLGYELGGNAVARAGRLVQVVTNDTPWKVADAKVYALSTNGTIQGIDSAATAVALFGANWESRIIPVPEQLFSNYTAGATLTSSSVLPDGFLVTDGTDTYLVDGGAKRAVSAEGFTANKYKDSDKITKTSLTAYTDGSAVSGAETGLFNIAGSASTATTPVAGGGLTVALASQSPAATTVPATSSSVFAIYSLSAGSDAAVSISSITLTAGGLGTSINIDDVTMYLDGSKVGTSKNINSDGVAVFNFSTPVELAAGAKKELTVKATAAAAGSGYYSLKIVAATDITTNGTVSGTFPISGNEMYADANNIIGTVGVSGVIGIAGGTHDFGEDNILLAGFNLTASNEDILWESMRLRNGGTNVDGIISNLRLLADGVEIAKGTYAGGYAEFANIGNYKIVKNDSVTIEVYGDLGVTNSNDTVKLYMKSRSDLVFTGVSKGFGVQMIDGTATASAWNHSTAGLGTSALAYTVTLSTGDFTIDMDKAATPAKDAKNDDNDVVLATFSMTSNGENATVDGIVNHSSDFIITGTGLTTDEIENVELVDVATGSVYDVTETFVDAATDHWTLSMTDEISLLKGVKKTFQLRADLGTSIYPLDGSETLYVVLGGTALSITGDSSNTTISGSSITPSSVTSAVTTIATPSLTWSTTSLTAKSLVSGATGVSIYEATLKAGTADGVKLNTVTLTEGSIAADDFTDANITKIDLFLDGKLLSSKSNSIVESTGSVAGYITFNSLSTTGNANVIPAGKTVVLTAKADFNSSFTLTNPATTFSLGIASATTSVVAKSVTGNNDVAENVAVLITSVATGSRTMTLAANGTLKVELKTTSTKADNDTYLLAGESTAANDYLGELVFTTANEDINVKELRLENSGTATSSDIASVSLIDKDGKIVATEGVASDGDVVFNPIVDLRTNTNYIKFPADQATSLFVVVNSKAINADGVVNATATHGRTVRYNINGTSGVVATGANSSATITLAASAVGIPAVSTITVNAVSADTETLTLDGCVITFATTGTEDLNCNDDVALINLTSTNSAILIAADLDTIIDTTRNYTSAYTASTAVVTVTRATTPTAGVIITPATVGDLTFATATGGTGVADAVVAGTWSDANVKTNKTVLTGSKLKLISNDMANGTLQEGSSKIIGKYKFVFDNGSNRKSDNTELKSIVDRLKISFSKSTLIVFGTGTVKAYIQGTSTKVACDTEAGFAAANTTGSAIWNAATLQGLADSGEVDGEVVLVIEATITGTSENQTVQTTIADTTGVGDFYYIGNGSTSGTAWADLYLSDTSVTGGTLTN
ncbi:MAG: hypothetical protein V1688_02225 [bacterium]